MYIVFKLRFFIFRGDKNMRPATVEAAKEGRLETDPYDKLK
jgi:hypothetical protein